MDQAEITRERPSTAAVPRIPARELETAVRDGIRDLLTSPAELLAALDDQLEARQLEQAVRSAGELDEKLEEAFLQTWFENIHPILKKVTFSRDATKVLIDRSGLRALLGVSGGTRKLHAKAYELLIPARLRIRGQQLKLIVGDQSSPQPKPNKTLIKAVCRAHDWFARLRSGEARSVKEIAKQDGVAAAYVSRLLPLALLAPDVVQAILDGNNAVELTVERFRIREHLPLAWGEQRRLFSG